ncbi:translocation/assembly module TamB domain-containing protein [Chitinimonas lacunae]|uniref:Translocation/assembly module TamB domain-containing protein n=1 Tax=Chitinimonas lacunae TaxID=1963018 RepID=A0ABV8MM42_9NEIS
MSAEAQVQTPAPTPRRRRFLAGWGGLLLGLLFISVLAGLLLATASETGTRALFRLAGWLSADSLRVEQVHGSLWGELRLEGLVLRSQDSTVTLDRAVLRWQPRRLAAGELWIDQLALGQLSVTSKPSTEPTRLPQRLTWPIAIQLRDARLDSLLVDGKPVLGPARARADSDGNIHRLELHQLTTPWFGVAGRLMLDGQHRLALGGEVRLLAEEWTVNSVVAGRLDSLELRGQGSGGPFSGHFDALIHPFAETSQTMLSYARIDSTGFDLATLGARLPRSALDLRLYALPAAGMVKGTLDLKNRLAGDSRAGRLPLKSLAADFRLDQSGVLLDRLDADLAGGRLLMHGKGSAQRVDLEAELSRIDPAAFGGPALPIDGRLTLIGPLEQPLIEADVELAGWRLLTRAEWLRAANSFEFPSLILSREQAKLSLIGSLALGEQAGVEFEGDLDHVDPASLGPLLQVKGLPSGDINARLRSEVRWARQLDALVDLVLRPSQLNGQPVGGKAKGRWRAQRLSDVVLDLNVGRNTLQAEGAFGQAQDRLLAHFALPALADLGKDFGGQAQGQLTLAGSFRQPRLSGEALIEALRLPGGVRVERAELKADLDASPQQPLDSPMNISLGARGVALADLTLGRADLQIKGRRGAHRAELSAEGNWQNQRFELRTAAAGGLVDEVWRGTLERLDAGGDWPVRLAAPVRLQLAQNGQSGRIESLQASVLGSELQLAEAEWRPELLRLRGDWRGVAVDRFMRRFIAEPQNFRTDLVVAAAVDVRLDHSLNGQIRLQRQSGDLVLNSPGNGAGSRSIALQLSRAEAVLNLSGDRAALEAQLRSQSFGSLDLRGATRLSQGEAGWHWSADAPVEGALNASMPSLAWAGPLLGPTVSLEGRFEAAVSVSGRRSDPQWRGELRGDQMAARLVELGGNWHDGTLRATLEGDVVRLDQLTLRGGDGTASASGVLSLGGRRPDAKASVRFERFGVLTRPDRRLTVSGNGELAFADEALTLTGQLRADGGHIELPRADVPALGDDVVIIGRPRETKPSGRAPPMTLALDIDLGDKLLFRGQGLEARLGGQLRLRASPTQTLAASGNLTVSDGRYAAYGQNLVIDRGVVSFVGPIDNPALDVRAIRPNLPVVVGVQVEGTALAPRVRLVSEEPMPDNEKLSWLVLGRPNPDKADASVLLTAAEALFSDRDSVSMRQQLADRLGLDDISITRSDAYTKEGERETALSGRVVSLGKRLSDRAYISYEQSLSGIGYAVKLAYTLSRRWSIKLSAGETTSVDLLYTLLFD